MVNKEKRYKTRTKAQGAILGAGITQGLIGIANVVFGARSGDILSFVIFGLTALGLAAFFIIFKHPAWGIAGTVLYVLGRVVALYLTNVLYQLTGAGSVLFGGFLGACGAAGVTAFFIYADYQAVLLRRLELEEEQDEEE